MTDPTAVIVETLEVVQIESTEVGLQGPPGINGPTDHGALTGRDNDGHPQYHTDARGDVRYAGLAHAHTGVYEPANANLQSHVSSTANPHSVTAAQAGADASGTAAGLIASHEAAANPHPGYLTPTEGDAAYAALGHAHTGVYDPAGTAASAVSAHAGGTDVHAIASVTGLQGALDGKSATSHDHAATYAPLASGVTHGDSHDHSGGDGAQISYATLSNLPTLGTAAATAATDYATASHNHTGTYVATGADAADLSSSTATDGYVLTADGAGGAAWEAAAVTYAGAASEIHAATDKATPVDADELGLVDSAASWGLKKLTWANLKTTLSSVFAVLAGKSGGQTLVGGTGVTDALTLQGTSGNGTVTATAVQVKVGNNGNLSALKLRNNGQLTLQGDATTDLPVYGPELLTSAGWTVNAGWTESPDDTFAHSSGTDTLVHSATITNATKYQISWTVTGRTAGSFTVAVGGQSTLGQDSTGSFGPTAGSTAAFTITPTADFNGVLSLVSLKAITAVSTPQIVIKNSGGTVILEERANSTSMFIGINAGSYNTTGSYNSFVGYNAGYSNTTGYNNSIVGYNAGYSNTTGYNNSIVGKNAGYSNTTGNYNSFVGADAGYSNTTGQYNSFVGVNAGNYNTTGLYNSIVGANAGRYNTTGNYNSIVGANAGYSNTTGQYNSFVGLNSGYSNTTGSYNSFAGVYAGCFFADGATPLTDPEYSIYIGYNAKGKDNSDNNSVVIGGNAPIGLGANTTVIGTSATTLTRLFGNIGAGVDSPSAAIHTIKTTEQLRLGYDVTNYFSATVSSVGNVTLDTTGGTIYTPDTVENTANGAGIVLKSPDGTRYRITVANGGTLSIAAA